ADGDLLHSRDAYRYDAVNTVRQAVAECGRLLLPRIDSARIAGDSTEYRRLASGFLRLIDLQDSITAMHPAMRLSIWLEEARAAAPTPADTTLWQANALLLITTWGPRVAADQGRLRDYSHREWSGLLGSLYRRRWATWFDARLADLQSSESPQIDFYALESEWIADPQITRPDTTFSTARLRSLLDSAITIIE
ncbi:MAG: alpha-N-acetylglucosaminidase C-terminal domain-containing protein, partial [Paramuribaculum sp.]|nr:alpha-N-acetylglucosaminidase C-terminal domain-containing protein [Paramuribaculum sp.]